MSFRLTRFCIRHPGLVLVVLAAGVVGGLTQLGALHFDLWPDINPVQVQVLTQVPDLAVAQSEATITRALELQLTGIPGLLETRSQTTFGISQITLLFRSGTPLVTARQWVAERLAGATGLLPSGYHPVLAPPSDGLGEIFTYAVEFEPGSHPQGSTEEQLSYLKQLQDFVIRPALRTVADVVEVNTTGGYDRAAIIEGDPRKLYQAGMDIADLANAVSTNVGVGGGARLDPPTGQMLIRSKARAQTLSELEQVAVKLSWGSIAVETHEVAAVKMGARIRFGAASLDGKEAVLGTVLLLVGENGRDTAHAVQTKLTEIQSHLPPQVKLVSLYNRGGVTDHVLRTIAHNLTYSVFLVGLILFGFLRSWRAALITLLVVPISFLFTLNALAWLGYSGNLMSLGALDFGLIVDGAVVIVDNILLRLRQRQQELGRTLEFQERRLLIQQASQEVSSPMIVGWFIILIAYLPALSLESIEGQMLHPLALTALLALAAALPLSLSLVPILCFGIRRAPAEPVLTQKWTVTYLNFLGRVFRHGWLVLGVVVAITIGSVIVGLHLGVDLFPVLNEGSTVLEVQRPPTVNLAESLAAEQETERALQSAFPEIAHIFARIGFSDIATDPQSPNQNDMYISYRPTKEWRLINNHPPTKAELESRVLAEARKRFPDVEFGLSQPIRLRFDEALEGVRSAFVVKIFGPDLDRLSTLSHEIQTRIERLGGVESVLTDPVETVASEEFHSDRPTMSRYLVKASEVDQALSVGIAGREIGRVDEAESFYPIIVRLPQTLQLPDLVNMPVRSAEGNLMLTLGQLGRFERIEVPNFVYHENGFRRRVVTVNLNGRDLGGFAETVRSLLAHEIRLEPGERIEYGGNYRLLSESIERLKWLVPLTLASFFVLLAVFLRSATRALIVYSALPFALVGGIVSLALNGMSLTLSAGVGLLAVAGIALLNKVVFIHHYAQLRAEQVPVLTAIQETTRRRLRPIVTTAAVAVAGFVPMLLSTELGAEVQRPIATVVIGGLFTSTVVTLVVLPLLLYLCERTEADPEIGTAAAKEEVQIGAEGRRPA